MLLRIGKKQRGVQCAADAAFGTPAAAAFQLVNKIFMSRTQCNRLSAVIGMTGSLIVFNCCFHFRYVRFL